MIIATSTATIVAARLLINVNRYRVKIVKLNIKSARSCGHYVENRDQGRIEHIEIFEKFVCSITSRILGSPIEYVEWICSLESGLSFGFICSVEILDIFGVIAKIEKCSTLDQVIAARLFRAGRQWRKSVVNRRFMCFWRIYMIRILYIGFHLFHLALRKLNTVKCKREIAAKD